MAVYMDLSKVKVVDLTGGESEAILPKDDPAESPPIATVPPAITPLRAMSHPSNDADEDVKTPAAATAVVVTPGNNDPNVCLGKTSATLVGMRQYNGTASSGDAVELVREPNNRYDSFAVAVNNSRGQKIGHISKEACKPLSMLLERNIRVEATMGQGDLYKNPIAINLYGKEARNAVMVQLIFDQNDHEWEPQAPPQAAPRRSPPPAPSSPEPMVPSVHQMIEGMMQAHGIDPSALEQSETAQMNLLDDLFDMLTKQQLKDVPFIPVPKGIKTKLLEHQHEGLRWLYDREITGKTPPFFNRLDTQFGARTHLWKSEITKRTQDSDPLPCKGSILADDMGLGKTIQAISLCLANPPDPHSSAVTTLVVCPVSVIQNWRSQIQTHCKKDALTVGVYHGPNRHLVFEEEEPYDILIAPYGTVSAEFALDEENQQALLQEETNTALHVVRPRKKQKSGRKRPTIFSFQFHRIILDEAHIIRNPTARMYKSCKALKATYRLCLTGTPLTNKPEDIYSLLSFLNVPEVGSRRIFNQFIAGPIYKGEDIGLVRLRAVMAYVALRRNKTKLDLVEKTVEVRKVNFPENCAHGRIYQQLFDSARCALRSLGVHRILRNYSVILEILTRIRQACVSGCLIPKERIDEAALVLQEIKDRDNQKKLTANEAEAILRRLQGIFDEKTTECSVCLESFDENDAVVLRTCSHVFCESCVDKVKAASPEPCCPFCRETFTSDDVVKKSAASAASRRQGEAVTYTSLDNLGPSPKLLALGKAINQMKPDEKGVIFSQFTKFLDRVQPYLTAKGYGFTRIDGTMSASQRVESMRAFSEERDTRFILCSLHAAGVGITLTRGNHCFLMDTWWNVSIENQAMDRVHRIGQTRPVRVVRFIMDGCIEEQMIKIQEVKEALGKGAMQRLDPDEARKARVGQLKSLFDL